jgi:hypothetical protein
MFYSNIIIFVIFSDKTDLFPKPPFFHREISEYVIGFQVRLTSCFVRTTKVYRVRTMEHRVYKLQNIKLCIRTVEYSVSTIEYSGSANYGI